jgi:anti-sigma B factor antagonist
MPEVRHLIEMVRGVPVVTLPAEVDVTSADVLRAALLLAPRHGHATIVVDMTQTQLCDSTGLNMLVRAHQRAAAEGGELRLVIPDASMLGGVLAVTGIDHLIPSFTSLDEALAETPAAAIRPPHQSLSAGFPQRNLGKALADAR